MAAAPVVFLDEDGTLIENVPYNADPDRVQLKPDAGRAAQLLQARGWRVAVITNQSGVARGYFPESALMGIESRVRELLAGFGVPLAGFYYCPHHPEGSVAEYSIACRCRKPSPGLILAGSDQLGVAPQDCWVIGDTSTDVEAGRRAGSRTVLISAVGIDRIEFDQRPDACAASLSEAAAIVLELQRQPVSSERN